MLVWLCGFLILMKLSKDPFLSNDTDKQEGSQRGILDIHRNRLGASSDSSPSTP